MGNLILNNLPKKKKGEVFLDIKFFIDVNGILTVTATEKSTGNTVETQIKNDSVNLTDEDIERLKEKNKKYLEKTKINKTLDFSNLKETLKDFQDAYNETEEEEDKFCILMNYNNTLEEFVDLFDINNFDNETMVEKYFIYVSQLINSFIRCLKSKKYCSDYDQKQIKEKIKKYVEVFSKISLGYLEKIIEDDLKVLIEDKELKKIFLEIILYAVEQLNERGKECLKKKVKFCKYNSLIYFEKSKCLFIRYIGKVTNLAICGGKLMNKAKELFTSNHIYINEINSGAILLFEESLKSGKLILSNETGFTKDLLNLKFEPNQDGEKYQIILSNYEKMLSEFFTEKALQKEQKKKVAICIANIIKISFSLLGYTHLKRYIELGEKCELYANDIDSGINKNEDWYKEFLDIMKEIKELAGQVGEDPEEEMKKKIKKKYKKTFNEIDSKYIKRKNDQEFIDYALKLKPYIGYEEDQKNNILEQKKKDGFENMVKYLSAKYHPNLYTYENDNEQTQLDYCIIEHIDSYLNRLFSII